MSNSSTANAGSTSNHKQKIEPVAGTAKIIHPDDDISLVSADEHILPNSYGHFLGRISCFIADI